jgi:hypothetical protein
VDVPWFTLLSNKSASLFDGEALFVHAAATSYRERSHFDGHIETGATQPCKAMAGSNRLTAMMAKIEADAGGPPRQKASRLDRGRFAPAARRPHPAMSELLPQASDALWNASVCFYSEDPQLSGLWNSAPKLRQWWVWGRPMKICAICAMPVQRENLRRNLNARTDGARIAMMELG